MTKNLKVKIFGRATPHKYSKSSEKSLTRTNIFGAPADNYSSGDIGKRKKTKT